MKQQLNKRVLKVVLATAIAVTLVTGCGSGGGDGGGNGGGGGGGGVQPVSAAQSVVDYILALINSSTSDLGDPIALDGVTLANDDAAEAIPLN